MFVLVNKSTDFDEILHRFFGVLPKGNGHLVRLIVLNPVSRTRVSGFVLFFEC